MKRLFLSLTAFLLLSAAANAQQQWSIEVGTGIQPLHMGFPGVSPTDEEERALAELGQSPDTRDEICPSVIVSGIWRYNPHCELVLTGNITWRHYMVIQYEQFGIDPKGKPRYNLMKEEELGWRDGFPVGSGTVQWRYLWNPQHKVKLYSGCGLGLSAGTYFIPTPSLTPLGVRFGGRHLYGFVEANLGPFATFADGGVGWTF